MSTNTVYANILTELQEGILTITLNRETKLNALTLGTLQEIRAAVQSAQRDPQAKGVCCRRRHQ